MPRIFGILQLGKTAFLKTLAQYYIQAGEQGRLDQFFDTLFIIWANWYPIDEFCNPDLRNDSVHLEAVTNKMQQVLFVISCLICYTNS